MRKISRKGRAGEVIQETAAPTENSAIGLSNPGRRKFIGGVGAVATAAAAAGAVGLAPLLRSESTKARAGTSSGHERAVAAFNVRKASAINEFEAPIPQHPNNGDETLYTNKIGNFSKGLPHNAIGEVNLNAYGSLLAAIKSGQPATFEDIILGGTTKLVDPQSGLAFDLEGIDSHQLALGPPPAVASQEIADSAVEDYWMAYIRDTNFTDYGTDPNAIAAATELGSLSAFTGPRINGQVTAQTLFRGQTAGDVIGPYVSQFFLQNVSFGAISLPLLVNTYLPLSGGGRDYMTDQPSWLAVQNGQGPFGSNLIDPTPRYIRNGRDLSAFVHIDVLYQAYFNAMLWLLDNAAPLNPGNPYDTSATQVGFGTFGAPHIAGLMAEAATRALKTVWYQKWFVHRHLRPEAYGGLVHMTKTNQASYPLHSDILNSQAVQMMFERNGTYFMPHAFPEGCPAHPSYGQGHGTVAGACVTMLKAFFDDTVPLVNIGSGSIVVASEDGLSLVPYGGSDAGLMTVGGELNKIAANVALGRDHSGTHWRYDYWDSILLGEALAISILKDHRTCFNEAFNGFTFTTFAGTTVTI